ncbi:hypothetical protein V8G54_035562 [Vigna mungo]|uniref:GDSL esterase/lipase n=1 Tax=Vigna mungo TaxID=3915 RepID=A0AAQ3RB49_VIGMU
MMKLDENNGKNEKINRRFDKLELPHPKSASEGVKRVFLHLFLPKDRPSRSSKSTYNSLNRSRNWPRPNSTPPSDGFTARQEFPEESTAQRWLHCPAYALPLERWPESSLKSPSLNDGFTARRYASDREFSGEYTARRWFHRLVFIQPFIRHISHLCTLRRTFLSSPSSKAFVTVLIRHKCSCLDVANLDVADAASVAVCSFPFRSKGFCFSLWVLSNTELVDAEKALEQITHLILKESPENKRRISIIKGIVIVRRNAGINATFRIRRQRIVPALYVFGDSTVDAGNNNNLNTLAKANAFPYGIDFNNCSTGRFSNGKTLADLIAIKLGLPMPPPYLGVNKSTRHQVIRGINYASGSCGILNSTRATNKLNTSPQLWPTIFQEAYIAKQN